MLRNQLRCCYHKDDHDISSSYNLANTEEYIALLEGIHVAIILPGPTIDICTGSLSTFNYLKYNLHVQVLEYSTALTVKISNIISKVNAKQEHTDYVDSGRTRLQLRILQID